MTTLTADFSKSNATISSKIGAALRTVFVRFVQAHEAQATLLTTNHDLSGAAELNRMANRFEASQPNLAAELRFIAARG